MITISPLRWTMRADEAGVAALHRIVDPVEGAEEEIALFRRDRACAATARIASA